MRILIVEDETPAYEILSAMLINLDSSLEIVGNTESVAQTIKWLQMNPKPDLIFMDIHLSDGSSFLLFDHINIDIPIVFTTAYDQYALDAFKVNSIDYLLKPIKEDDLKRALSKFTKLSNPDILAYLSRMALLQEDRKSYQDRLLIPIKDKLMPISVGDISYFYTTDRNTLVQLRDGEQYSYSKTLDQIISNLDPQIFYRANKQFIVHRDSVKDITIWFDSRLLISMDTDTPERIYVSKNKASSFKAWMMNE